ncbi:MAG TPA: radical SAM protein [Bryobacteraceae bacterium]|nr:radical SAM protein [Bryobacteraceae bacterium]
MSGSLLLLKTITALRPFFFESRATGSHAHFDGHLRQSVTSIDLGLLHWNLQLDEPYLRHFLSVEMNQGERDRVSDGLDAAAVASVAQVKRLLAAFAERMLTADEIIFCFRVLSRCASLVSKHEPSLDLHLARGLLAKEYDQYQLAEVLKAAENPGGTGLGRYFAHLLELAGIPQEPAAAVVNLRNDGELNQAFLIASIIRKKSPATVIILDTSGANEQYNFGEWVPLLTKFREGVSRYFDYFLPRQDYKASLSSLLEAILAGSRPIPNGTANVVSFIDAASARGAMPPLLAVEESFTRYIDSLPVFRAAGQRTIVGRLSPSKCHWAACKFCTINSQHLMPRGLAVFDDHYERDFDILVRKIRKDHIESLILMDEALHPKVLLAFADRLLARGVSIVYRARCRFTNDLTPEACKKLYDSGCRYLGLGLEAASARVNALVNKHAGAPIDYERVLSGLDNAGIRMHIYAILGFPTETREEITRTATFLIESIARHRYLTVSANLFYLMRGSGIAADPEQFNIQRISEAGDVALVLQFDEPERNENYSLAEQSVQRVFQAEFFPDTDEPAAQAFWHFIDQTGMFYVQKVIHAKNPFHALAERRNTPLPQDFLEARYQPSGLFWLDESEEGDSRLLCDWVTFHYAQIPLWLRDFLLRFDYSCSLRANVERLLPRQRWEETYGAFRTLAENGFLLTTSAGMCPQDGAPLQSIFRDATARTAAAGTRSIDLSFDILSSTARSEVNV